MARQVPRLILVLVLGLCAPAALAQQAPRYKTPQTPWEQLSPGERTRARAIHLDTRPDHVTVALQPSALHPFALAKDS